MKNPPVFLILLVALMAGEIHGAEKNNPISPELDAALSGATSAILYSLEPITDPNPPGPKLHGFKILGQTKLDQQQTIAAVKAFRSAISGWDGNIAACFDPRHALRVRKSGQTYDLLICYACHNLYVYRGDKSRTSFASFGATGSPETLNRFLIAAKVPLSTSH
jgi:hypothetical protein